MASSLNGPSFQCKEEETLEHLPLQSKGEDEYVEIKLEDEEATQTSIPINPQNQMPNDIEGIGQEPVEEKVSQEILMSGVFLERKDVCALLDFEESKDPAKQKEAPKTKINYWFSQKKNLSSQTKVLSGNTTRNLVEPIVEKEGNTVNLNKSQEGAKTSQAEVFPLTKPIGAQTAEDNYKEATSDSDTSTLDRTERDKIPKETLTLARKKVEEEGKKEGKSLLGNNFPQNCVNYLQVKKELLELCKLITKQLSKSELSKDDNHFLAAIFYRQRYCEIQNLVKDYNSLKKTPFPEFSLF